MMSWQKNNEWAGRVRDGWVADWDYIHCAFHSVGFMCDPEFARVEKPDHVNVEFLEVAERLLRSASDSLGLKVSNLDIEMETFQSESGFFSKRDIVWKQAPSIPGHVWWKLYGSSCPTLQWLAMRILAQPTSAAAAKSAWSEFDFVFNRRRTRLDKERASKLVFYYCNARLMRKFQGMKQEMRFHPQHISDKEAIASDEEVSA